MRNYDLTVLINTEGGEDAAKANHAKLNDIITSYKGTIYASAFNGRIELVNTFQNTVKLTPFAFNILQAPSAWTHFIKNLKSMRPLSAKSTQVWRKFLTQLKSKKLVS